MRGGYGKIFGNKGNLVIEGIYKTSEGPIPFSVSLPVRGIPDGPVNIRDPKIGRALKRSEPIIVESVKQQKLARAIKELVDRTRLGDQNAMAMLRSIRIQAEKGNPQAQQSRKLIIKYLKKYPATQDRYDTIGIDRPAERLRRKFSNSVNSGIRMLCRSCLPILSCAGIVEANKPQVKSQIARINGEDLDAYRKGLQDWKEAASSSLPWMKLGGVVGFIRELNATRKGGAISKLSPMAGWELGE